MSWLSPLLIASMLAAPSPVVLPVDQAQRADTLASHVGVQHLMQGLEADASQVLVIGHAGGEAGSARANQLRSALVALGLSSARILLSPQPLETSVLTLTLEKSTP